MSDASASDWERGSWVRSSGELKRVHGGNGYSCDFHEFVITSRGTALISIYNTRTTSLAAIGGSTSGQVVEGIVQELDIKRRKVRLEWHSLDHVGLDESNRTTPDTAGSIDYFHLNSIGVDSDGDLLVSARNTRPSTSSTAGRGVVWRLGGARSDFELGPGAAFAYQHDVRRHADGTLTLYDNGASAVSGEGRRRGFWVARRERLGQPGVRRRLSLASRGGPSLSSPGGAPVWLAKPSRVDASPSGSSTCGRGGRESVKRVPPPAAGSAVTVPPCASATCRTIARPRPEPGRVRAAAAR